MRRHRTIALLTLCAGLLASPAAFAQKAKDIVRIAQAQTIGTLDAYMDPRPEVYFLSDAVFDTLIVYDAKKKGFSPLLAKSWTRIDARTLEFDLRDDVTWHDGKPFSADDVIYTINWLNDPQTNVRFKNYYSWIEKVEKLSPSRLRLTSVKPTPFDLAMLASPNVLPIFPKHIHEAMKDKLEFGRAPIGTGPYWVVSLDINKGVTLTKRDAYPQGNDAKYAGQIRTLQVVPLPDTGTRAAAMMVGEIDMMRDIPIDMAENLASMPNLGSTVTSPIGSSYLLMDAAGRSGRKELQDVRVRRAIMMAVNSTELTQMIVGKLATGLVRQDAMCNRAQMGCDYSVPLPAFDLAGARKLLAEAGYANGFDIEITAPSAHSGRLGEILSGRLREIGIRAKVDTLTFAAYRDKQAKGKIELLVNGWGGGGVADVQATLDFFFSPGPTDYFGLPRLSELAKASGAEMDDGKRRALVREIFDTVTNIAYMAPITPQPAVWVHSKDITVSGDSTFSAWGGMAYQIGWK